MSRPRCGRTSSTASATSEPSGRSRSWSCSRRFPALFILNYLVLMPVFARDILQIGAPGLGLLNASLGVGALTRRDRHRRDPAAEPAAAGGSATVRSGSASIGLIVFGLSTWHRRCRASLSPPSAAARSPITQRRTRSSRSCVSPRLRGRVLSLYVLTSLGVIPFGNLLAGAVGGALWRAARARRRRNGDAADPHRGRDQLPVAAARSPGADRRARLKPFGASLSRWSRCEPTGLANHRRPIPCETFTFSPVPRLPRPSSSS